jgi:hypothetical protein
MTPAECDRFEVEIGMRQHGALDRKEEAALDAHLVGCAACRQFAVASGDTEAALRTRAASDVRLVDWSELQRGVHRLGRSYRRKLWLAPIFLLQVPLIFLLGTGHLPPRELLTVGPFATVGLYLGYLWLVNRPFREVMAVVKHGDDLLLGYTRELRRQRLRARIFVVYNGLLALGCLGGVLAAPNLRVRLFSLGCTLLFAAWTAYDLRWKLPRLRRALAEVAE